MPPPPPPPPPAPGTAVTTGTSPSRGARRAAPASTRLVASGRASLARGAAESRTDAERLGDRGRKREDRGVREASTATPSSGSSRVPSLNRMSARGPCGAGGPCGPCGCAPLGTALGTALSQRSRAADRAERAIATATQNDEDFALALLEQDLQEAEAGAREREARARRRANRRSLEEDELLAMMLAISQVQADEQQLQEALDESQRPHGEVSDAQLEQIQRKSLLESIRAQLPVTRWAKDSHQPGECALCLDEYSAGDCVTRLTCFHAFHKSCLDPWLDKSPTCPSCKFDLLSEIHGM